jgi:hypothetical protein
MLWMLRHSHWWERPAMFLLGRGYQRIKNLGWNFYYWAALRSYRRKRDRDQR